MLPGYTWCHGELRSMHEPMQVVNQNKFSFKNFLEAARAAHLLRVEALVHGIAADPDKVRQKRPGDGLGRVRHQNLALHLAVPHRSGRPPDNAMRASIGLGLYRDDHHFFNFICSSESGNQVSGMPDIGSSAPTRAPASFLPLSRCQHSSVQLPGTAQFTRHSAP